MPNVQNTGTIPSSRCLLRPPHRFSFPSCSFHSATRCKRNLLLSLLTKESENESEVAQSCPTFCDPMDYSLPHSSVHGILQARVLAWVATSFCRGSSWPRDRTQVSHIVGRHFTIWATREAKRPSSPTHPGFKLSQLFLGLPRWCCGQETARQCRRLKRHGFNPWVGKIPWRRAWQPTPVFLPGESHKHSDTTEATWHAHSISYLPPTQQHLKQCEAAHVCVATSEDRMRNRCEPGKRRAKRDELKRISQRQGQGVCI